MGRTVFKCLDGHTCGNPVRLILEGAPDLKGTTMREKRLHFLEEFDWIRKGLMFEPRGHDMMSGAFIYPPAASENDIGVVFIETSGCLPMCGHGSIGVITMGIESGKINPKVPGIVRMETPAGLVIAKYHQPQKKVEWVQLQNVPSFLIGKDLQIDFPVLGSLSFDVAYGGNFYAIVEPQKNFKGLQDYTAAELIEMARALRKLINLRFPQKFIHPEDSNIEGISHILWTGDTLSAEADGRNAVFYGDKAIDRSPCGTGTSARMAQRFAKGMLKPGETFVHESIIGSKFVGKVAEVTRLGSYEAIIPSIRGWAHQFGQNTITIDDSDPYAHGFQVL